MSDAHEEKTSTAKRARTMSPGKTDGTSEEGDSSSEETHTTQPCMPCHGSGKVISNLGGHARLLTCPWCRGTGERLTGVDAQEFQQEQAALKSRR